MSQASDNVKLQPPMQQPETADSNPPSLPPTIEITPDEADALRNQFSRTPRPYFHDGIEVLQDRGHRGAETTLSNGDVAASPVQSPRAKKPAQEKQEKAWEEELVEGTASRRPPHRRRRIEHAGGSGSFESSGSGTEADDERPASGFARALPAPTLRPRKGLKTGELNEDALLTPSQLDDEGRRLTAGDDRGYFNHKKGQKDGKATSAASSVAEARAEQEMLLRRRVAEFLRRTSEVALTGVIIVCVLCGGGVAATAWTWRWELLAHVAAIVTLILAYPFKVSIVLDRYAQSPQIWRRFRVPASFDPATVLYPPLLPVLVALSVAPANPAVLLPNMILGLASLPQRLFPRSSRLGGINAVHWFVSIIPLIVSGYTSYMQKVTPLRTSMFRSSPPLDLTPEVLVSLYPLHHALLHPLYYLTTTSLLTSELHLLSVALINLSLLSVSPQAVILKACLWIGGISLFLSCNSLLCWNVTLARAPRWKLRRPGNTSSERKSLIDAVSELINIQHAVEAFRAPVEDSDADEDEPETSIKTKSAGKPKLSTAGVVFQSLAENVEPKSATESQSRTTKPRPRRNTVPEQRAPPIPSTSPAHRKGRKSTHLPWYLQLTPEQAIGRKWLYAGITYLIITLLTLGPIRIYVSKDALDNQEPITWAIHYLFGQILEYQERMLTLAWLEPTISYVPPWNLNPIRIVFGMANARLVIIAYWFVVLLAGLATVFSLSAFVEVDTRRKVFHGVMVAMLLPATYFDPCFTALALGLVLAAFLLLEVLRAAQVPPLGNAIGRFVAPYVDGRDLRGPVVVSHVFLLVGCAVPLWFSLAGLARSGNRPWARWEVAGNVRDTAMLAGVVCVGMGDAAASLIGRRYGRHKWPWVGGKSLEGSAAFAVAVTVGLLLAKWWLVNCGWADAGVDARFDAGVAVFVVEWGRVLLKAAFCACAASFMEAVLTGANDNVVVPIVLWLLVKGVRL